MIELWDFQRAAVDATLDAMQANRKLLVVSPGGSGKTVMIGSLARRLVASGSRKVIIVSHRKEIIEQTFSKLILMGADTTDVGILRGCSHLRLHAPILVASIQSLSRRHLAAHVDHLIIDEAHHAVASSYERVARRYASAKQVGFTATPVRLDGRGLGDIYNDLFIAALPSSLIEKQRLAAPLVYRAPKDLLPDLRDLRIAHGDYAVKQLEGRAMERKLIGGLVQNYVLRANEKRAIVFAVSITHSRMVAEQFNAAGIPAAHVGSDLGEEERERTLAAFKAGTIKVLTNCVIVSEGYDLPECEAVILARPTQSLALYIQQAARAMRYMPGKRPVLLDHAQLMDQFGLPDADRHFELTTTKPKAKVIKPGPVKDCPECSVSISAACRSCPSCSHEFREAFDAPEPEPAVLALYSEEDRQRLERRLLEKYPPEWAKKILEIWAGYRTGKAA